MSDYTDPRHYEQDQVQQPEQEPEESPINEQEGNKERWFRFPSSKLEVRELILGSLAVIGAMGMVVFGIHQEYPLLIGLGVVCILISLYDPRPGFCIVMGLGAVCLFPSSPLSNFFGGAIITISILVLLKRFFTPKR